MTEPTPTRLDGHVAVVTGGSSGIGLGIAAGLAEAGARVAVWSRTADRSDSPLRELGDGGRDLLGIACDVSRESDVEAAMQRTVDCLGPVDSCFAAAGINRQDASLTLSADDFRSVLRTNLDGTFLALRTAARHMSARGRGGSLAAVSSIAATTGQSRTAHYAASKAALGAMVRTLAVELAPHHIRVNTIVPGFVATPMLAPFLSSRRFVDRVLPRVPLRRWATPSDFGSLAVQLAGPTAQGLTGTQIVVDGGYSRSWH
ncbi:SDR family NAD(P)-dependent oxidoreductase [Streptomyces griseoviridis]